MKSISQPIARDLKVKPVPFSPQLHATDCMSSGICQYFQPSSLIYLEFCWTPFVLGFCCYIPAFFRKRGFCWDLGVALDPGIITVWLSSTACVSLTAPFIVCYWWKCKSMEAQISSGIRAKMIMGSTNVLLFLVCLIHFRMRYKICLDLKSFPEKEMCHYISIFLSSAYTSHSSVKIGMNDQIHAEVSHYLVHICRCILM